jgi:hypothetical protein
MEPVFMILAQSAATAAVMAIDDKTSVQDVPYAKLRERLLKDGQILEAPHLIKGKPVSKLEGVVVDDNDAKLVGEWPEGKGGDYVALSYRHDQNERDLGIKTALFEAKLPKAGKYEVRVSYADLGNRSTKAKFIVGAKGGDKVVTVNQRKKPEIDGLFTSLGTFEFSENARVTLSNEGSDGHVIADAVQWLPK